MMILKKINLIFVRCTELAIPMCFLMVSLVVCACSSAQDTQPISQLTISPDGNEFVFRYMPPQGGGQLVHFDTSTGALQIFPQPADEVWWNPTYSTDGKWLAIGVYAVDAQHTVQYSASRIDVMRADGTGRRNVVPQNGLVKGIFKFSPDDSKLIFSEATRQQPHPTGFNLREVDLKTLVISTIVEANFYQLSSIAYFNKQFAYVGDIPQNYLDSQEPAPEKYIATASVDQKNKWTMSSNSMMYVTDALPEKLTPYVNFGTNGSSRAWQQNEEIEGLRVASTTNRVFVTMRHNDYPQDRDIHHFIRDVFEMNVNHTFRRLTFLNTVQFYGFDTTPDGRYVAIIPDSSDKPASDSRAIYRIDSANGEVKLFKPDLSKLLMPH